MPPPVSRPRSLAADLPYQCLVEAAAVDAVGIGSRPDRLQPPACLCQRGEVAVEEVELVLDPDLRLEPERADSLDQPPQHDPRVERHVLPAGKAEVPKYPDRTLVPGQQPGRGEVRHREDVGEALLLARE